MNRTSLFGLVVSALMVIPNAWAQGDDPQICTACYCVADAPCREVISRCNDLSLNCPQQEFTAPCGGQWTLKAELSCPSGTACEYCQACVRLYEEETQSTTLIHTGCVANECSVSQSYTMTYGYHYKIRVCLDQCDPNICSDTYCDNCVARGWIYSTWSACSNCNP